MSMRWVRDGDGKPEIASSRLRLAHSGMRETLYQRNPTNQPPRSAGSMTEYVGSSKPISVTTMKECCLASIEAYVKVGGSDFEGTVVKCETYPKSSDHRITVKGGKWVGKIPLKIATPKK